MKHIFSKAIKLSGSKLCFYYAFIYNKNILSLGLLPTPALWIVSVRQEIHNKVAKPSSNGSQSFLPQTCSARNLNLLFPKPLFHLPCIWVTQRIISLYKSELSSLLSMQQWQKAASLVLSTVSISSMPTYPQCWETIDRDQQLWVFMCSCVGTGWISGSQALSSPLWCLNPDHSSVHIRNGINPGSADCS